MKSQFDQLVKKVIEKSESNNWNIAKTEWTVFSLVEDTEMSSDCICGQENLRYLYTIKNKLNDNTLFPIGSHCINQFNQSELDEEVSVYRKLFDLLLAVQNKDFIKLNSTYFSRKLLMYLYENNAFQPNKFNHGDPENDYAFLVQMFNKRNQPSYKQQMKIKALIMKSIIPFAKNLINANENKSTQ